MTFFKSCGLLATLVLALTSAQASAATLFQYSGNNGTTAGGYHVGPQSGLQNYDPATKTGQSVKLVCVDFLNSVSDGQTWEANLTYLGKGADLSQTRFGGAANGSPVDALQRYQMAAWLATQFKTTATTKWGEIQFTIGICSPPHPQRPHLPARHGKTKPRRATASTTGATPTLSPT